MALERVTQQNPPLSQFLCPRPEVGDFTASDMVGRRSLKFIDQEVLSGFLHRIKQMIENFNLIIWFKTLFGVSRIMQFV